MTRFLGAAGTLQIVDYMPLGVPEATMRERWLIRQVKVVRGTLTLRVHCQPAFNYARDPHETEIGAQGAVFHTANHALGLSAPVPLHMEDGAAVARFTAREGDTLIFSLQLLGPDAAECLPPLELMTPNKRCSSRRRPTGSTGCRTMHVQRPLAQRSSTARALALKLLTYEPTGAIVAAPTCGLPGVGRGRAELGLPIAPGSAMPPSRSMASMRIGFTEEAARGSWELAGKRASRKPETMRHAAADLYAIDGRHEIPEETTSITWTATGSP